MSTRETQIKAFKNLQEYFQEGGKKFMIHCAVNGSTCSKLFSYRHHYIVLGHTWCSDCESIEIIHFSACANQSSNGKVLKETYSKKNLREDIDNGLYIIESDSFPKNEKEYDKAYGRFKEKTDEEKYCILNNNCEHLVNYVLTGEHTSEQIKQMGCLKKLVVYVCNISLCSNKSVPWPSSRASAECCRRNPSPSETKCKRCRRNLPSSAIVVSISVINQW